MRPIEVFGIMFMLIAIPALYHGAKFFRVIYEATKPEETDHE